MKIDWKLSKKPFAVLILSNLSERVVNIHKPSAVELRLDLIGLESKPERIKSVSNFINSLNNKKISVLITARRRKDGGIWQSKNEDLRRETVLKLANLVDAIDIEAELLTNKSGKYFLQVIKKRIKKNCKIIMSHHNMKRMLSINQLDRLMKTAIQNKADRLKIAAYAKTEKDAEVLSDWAINNSSQELPITAIAMGIAGEWTRWLLPIRLGGPAYAPLCKPVAPGQISYREIIKLL